MDLVEGGDVRRLFSDEELLQLVGAEEEYERQAMTGTHKNQGGLANASHTSRHLAGTSGDGGRQFPAEEALPSGEAGQGRPGSLTASKDEVCNK